MLLSRVVYLRLYFADSRDVQYCATTSPLAAFALCCGKPRELTSHLSKVHNSRDVQISSKEFNWWSILLRSSNSSADSPFVSSVWSSYMEWDQHRQAFKIALLGNSWCGRAGRRSVPAPNIVDWCTSVSMVDESPINHSMWIESRSRQIRSDQKTWAEDEQEFWECVTLSEPDINLHPAMQGGSRPGKRPNIDRDRHEGHERIWKDYFADIPVYTDKQFRRRYRMRRPLFWRIHDAVVQKDLYFVQKKDATGVLGLSSIQKITAALRMLSLGVSVDALDEYVRIAKTIALKSLKRFTQAIRSVFEEEYLRQPTKKDLQKQLQINEERGFLGMFASIDCMHYEWKNCPVAWQGLFTNKDGEKSIVLEAVADQALWIWHAYFGLPGGNNDLNVLDRSPLVNNFLRSDAASVGFTINDREYSRYYLLADEIYPDWSIFVKTISLPQGNAWKWFAKCQEGARKDVERAFGVLHQRFAIVKNPVCMHYQHEIPDILLCCVILHNMIACRLGFSYNEHKTRKGSWQARLEGVPSCN